MDRYGLAAGCTSNVPGCRAYRLLLPVYAGPYRMVGFETGVGLEALGGADGWAGGAAALMLCTNPVLLQSDGGTHHGRIAATITLVGNGDVHASSAHFQFTESQALSRQGRPWSKLRREKTC